MIYQIYFDNYQGETFTELYHHKVNALKRMRELRREGKTHSEFNEQDNTISFFDANYNEYSTYITLSNFNSIDDLFED